MTGGKAPAVEPRPVTVAARGGPPSLARAVEYMHRHAGEPLTVRAVARAARVSSRALQHSFARHLGTSPQAYLHYCRLDGARAELLAAEPGTVTVRQVAANWQFSNAGRFAADYRRQFGEAPSTTLRS